MREQRWAPLLSDIFLSYRGDDASGHAGRLFDRLTAHFERDRVFKTTEGRVLSGGERVPRGSRLVVRVSTGVPCCS